MRLHSALRMAGLDNRSSSLGTINHPARKFLAVISTRDRRGGQAQSRASTRSLLDQGKSWLKLPWLIQVLADTALADGCPG